MSQGSQNKGGNPKRTLLSSSEQSIPLSCNAGSNIPITCSLARFMRLRTNAGDTFEKIRLESDFPRYGSLPASSNPLPTCLNDNPCVQSWLAKSASSLIWKAFLKSEFPDTVTGRSASAAFFICRSTCDLTPEKLPESSAIFCLSVISRPRSRKGIFSLLSLTICTLRANSPGAIDLDLSSPIAETRPLLRLKKLTSPIRRNVVTPW